MADDINRNRLASWNHYYEGLKPLADKGLIELPYIPEECVHNAHMFYIKVKDLDERTALISHLKKNGIMAVFHYIPLHTSKAGKKWGEFHGEDRYTTKEGDRLMRLPMYYNLRDSDINKIIDAIYSYWK